MAILLKQFKEAIDDFNKTLELNPNYTDGYNNRGLTYLLLNNTTAALKDFNQALIIKPDSILFLTNRIKAHIQNTSYDLALQDAQRIKELGGIIDPTLIDAIKPKI